MPTIAGSGFSGGSLAAILARPVDTFALRNQKRQEGVALLGAIQQQEQNRLAQLEAREGAMQSDMAAIANLDMLSQGKARINAQVAAPIKDEIKRVIKDEYGGDYESFLAGHGAYFRQKAKDAVQSNPVIQQELQSKLNYAMQRKDQMDGKILRPGDIASFQAYQAGENVPISYSGGIEPPKDIYEFFQKNENPSMPHGQIDWKTGAQTPIPVSRQDVYNKLKEDYSAEDARYLLDNHLGYKDGGVNWKVKELAPTWLMDAKLKQDKFGLDRQKFARNNYQQDRMFGLASARERRMAEKDTAGGKASKLTSALLEENIFGASGTPLQSGSRIMTQPLLSKNDREVLQDLMGARYEKQTDASGFDIGKKFVITPRPNIEMYNATERTKEGTAPTKGRSSYVTQYKGIANPFVSKFLGADGTIQFDNVDLSKVVKIPTPNGYKPAVLATKVINGTKQQAYVVIPQDEATKRQLRTHPAANRAKAEARAAQGQTTESASPTAIPFVPLDSEEDDNN
jgi:hypothetical protein